MPAGPGSPHDTLAESPVPAVEESPKEAMDECKVEEPLLMHLCVRTRELHLAQFRSPTHGALRYQHWAMRGRDQKREFQSNQDQYTDA